MEIESGDREGRGISKRRRGSVSRRLLHKAPGPAKTQVADYNSGGVFCQVLMCDWEWLVVTRRQGGCDVCICQDISTCVDILPGIEGHVVDDNQVLTTRLR